MDTRNTTSPCWFLQRTWTAVNYTTDVGDRPGGSRHAIELNATKSTTSAGDDVDDVDRNQTSGEFVELIIYSTLIPIVCIFGIIGNVANLLVFMCRGCLRNWNSTKTTSPDKPKVTTLAASRMERSANWTLTALAACDLAICVFVLPNSWFVADVISAPGMGRASDFLHTSFDFRIACKLYGPPIVNVLQLMSTWLTVAVSFSWYLVVSHPFVARRVIGRRYAVVSLSTVIVVCAAFNVPRFFYDELHSITCGTISDAGPDPDIRTDNGSSSASPPFETPSDDIEFYFVFPGLLRRHPVADRVYSGSYFVLGIVIPLSVLVFSSWHLASGLRKSAQLTRNSSDAGGRLGNAVADRTDIDIMTTSTASGPGCSDALVCRQQLTSGIEDRKRSSTSSSTASRRRLMMTTVLVVFGHVVFFLPAELFGFFTELASERSHRSDIYNASMAVGNLLQVLNFAANFIVYCTVYARRATGNGDQRTKRLIIGAVAASSSESNTAAASRALGSGVVKASNQRHNSSVPQRRLEQRRCAFVTIS